ncbi:MAG: DUF1501 domain-containing protein [Planctomycetota bacterium]|jgi:hypothetical protein|nr:DUF1501 domain-containing protein [Planctomycetota bacterium]
MCGGRINGATAEFGYRVARDKVIMHGLQATILYQLGPDHTRLTHQYAGRDFRLTDVDGDVVQPIVG